MNILITNDDGIGAVGLPPLVIAARERGHKAYVSAPCAEQSAQGQRITMNTPLFVHEHPIADAPGYAVDGSPADCVRVARDLFGHKADFCLSGINNGENVGAGLYYSGTFAAAREAAMLYIPSIAVSIMRNADDRMRLSLARRAVAYAEYLVLHPMPRLCVCNLNAPALPPEQLKPMMLADICPSYYTDGYEKRQSPRGATYFWMDSSSAKEPDTPGCDQDLLNKGHVTCTFVGGLSVHNALYGDIPRII